MREFELAKYLRASKKLDLEGIDFDAVPRYPLSREEIRVLTYMMDIETHTIIYLRDLLTTPAAYDPEITAFLSLWAYEEFWHGEALSRFLRAAGERFSPDRPGEIRRAAGLRDGAGTIAKMAAARAVPDFVAVHMTWGAINELSTLNGYHRVIAGTRNPILVELLGRIIKDERRHYAFYYNQARHRLDGNARAQRLVRWTLDRFWEPVGSGVRPQAETDFVVRHLFGDGAGRAALHEMERELSKLPGLGGMRLIRRAMHRAERREGRGRASRPALPVAASLLSFLPAN
ncbi:MAG: ferritin-like domain-containing protein [Actinomycetota bacterium]